MLGGFSIANGMQLGFRALRSILAFNTAILIESLNQKVVPIPAAEARHATMIGHLAFRAYFVSTLDGELEYIMKHYNYGVEAEASDRHSGFRTVLFLNKLTNHRVMSFAGTDDLGDAVADSPTSNVRAPATI